jgi:hypothetical protein
MKSIVARSQNWGKNNTEWNLVQKTGDFHQKNSEIWRPLEKKFVAIFTGHCREILPGKRTPGSLAFGARDLVGGPNLGVPKILTLVNCPIHI